jgi:hypothetical protein
VEREGEKERKKERKFGARAKFKVDRLPRSSHSIVFVVGSAEWMAWLSTMPSWWWRQWSWKGTNRGA